MSNIKRYAAIAERYLEYMNYLLIAIAGLVIAALMFCIVYQVLMRFFFDETTTWLKELAEYSMIFIIFLPLARVEQLQGHIRVDAITMRFSKKTNNRLNIVTLILSLIFIGYFAWSAIEETRYYIDTDKNSGQWNLGLDQWPVIAMMAIGLSCLWLNLLVSFIKSIADLFPKERSDS